MVLRKDQGIATDVAGPFLETDPSNEYIVVVIDHLSKWAKACFVPNLKSPIVADLHFY